MQPEEEKAKEGTDSGKDIVVELDSKEQALLEYGQKQFEKWLKNLSVEKLEDLVSKMKFEEHAETRVKDYLAEQKEKAPFQIGVCSKCRYRHGCEVCAYDKALKLVVRKRDVPAWLRRKEDEALKKGIEISAVVQSYNIYNLTENAFQMCYD